MLGGEPRSPAARSCSFSSFLSAVNTAGTGLAWVVFPITQARELVSSPWAGDLHPQRLGKGHPELL